MSENVAESEAEAESDEFRMYLIARTDLPAMTAGKLAVQAGHGFTWLADKVRAEMPDLLRAYNESGATAKVCVGVGSLAGLSRAAEECMALGIPSVVITDAARTCFPEPTPTVCAVGPVRRRDLPKFVRRLRLY